MTHQYRPMGGKLITKTTVIYAILSLIAAFFLAKRMIYGLGDVTNLNNGYPWGIWVVYDVVIGTALACGGYAMAMVCYIMNKGKYHPLVRPALLASCLGYTLGGVAILFDLGRWWNAWHILVPGYWQPNSVMFEVALCVMSYIIVLWIEFAPAFLNKLGLTNIRAKLEKVLFVFIALGCLLPTMHQSSLGTLLVVLGYQIDALWQTPMLPLLFLMSAITMGFAIVVFESVLGSAGFRHSIKHEMPALGSLAKIITGMTIIYLVLRFGDLAYRGAMGNLFNQGLQSLMFWIEITLFLVPVILFTRSQNRTNRRALFIGATALVLAGALYRLDAFLIAHETGPGWNYFPSIPEMMVTFGIIAFEVLVYIILVRVLPVLTFHSAQGPVAARDA